MSVINLGTVVADSGSTGVSTAAYGSNTIVQRDGSGNFLANVPTLNGTILSTGSAPTVTSSQGALFVSSVVNNLYYVNPRGIPVQLDIIANDTLFIEDDFAVYPGFSSTSTSSVATCLPYWALIATGTTGGFASNQNITGGTQSTVNHPGTLQIQAGTSSTCSAGIQMQNAFTDTGIAGQQISCTWIVKIPVLSNGTTRFSVNCGLFQPATGLPSTNNLFFSYTDNSGSGQWVANWGGVGSAISKTVVAGTWYVLTLTYTTGASSTGSCVFTATDATSSASQTISSISNIGNFTLAATVNKSATSTTAVNLYVDYASITYNGITNRTGA